MNQHVNGATEQVVLGDGVDLRGIKQPELNLKLRRLRDRDLPAICALQNKVNAELVADGHGAYVVVRREESFAAHLEALGVMLGVFDGERLVAQSLMGLPPRADSDHGCDLQPEEPADKLVVMKGVLVDAAYRGNHLMQRMGEVGLGLARLRGRHQLVAEAAVGNIASWCSMLALGMRIVACDEAPSDHEPLYLVRRKVADRPAQTVQRYLNPTQPWRVQRKTFGTDGYHGVWYRGGQIGLAAAD